MTIQKTTHLGRREHAMFSLIKERMEKDAESAGFNKPTTSSVFRKLIGIGADEYGIDEQAVTQRVAEGM